jgi:hypothetical protein
MRARHKAGHLLSAVAGSAMLAGLLSALGTKGNDFAGVTVLSACNAWAVGSQTNTNPANGNHVTSTLIEHWNSATATTSPR